MELSIVKPVILARRADVLQSPHNQGSVVIGVVIIEILQLQIYRFRF